MTDLYSVQQTVNERHTSFLPVLLLTLFPKLDQPSDQGVYPSLYCPSLSANYPGQ